MYMHGLVPSPELQEREQLMHCAMYILEERAPDDPWDALKRILRAKTDGLLADFITVGSSPGLLAKGLAMRLFATNAAPQRLKDFIVNMMIRFNPNFVVREFQSRGLPHKLTGLVIDAITEQRPNPDSRITLSHRTDALGVPLPRVDWRIWLFSFMPSWGRKPGVLLSALGTRRVPLAGALARKCSSGFPEDALARAARTIRPRPRGIEPERGDRLRAALSPRWGFST